MNFMDSEAAFTTVGELRKLLEGVVDETPVTISAIPGDAVPQGHCILSTIGDEIQRPELVHASARHLVSAICICEVGNTIGEQS